jgi:hypothetical protein
MDSQTDLFHFENVIEELHHDFQQNPLHYGNEDPLVPELVYRLRRRLDPEYLPVVYRQEYGDAENEWRVRDFWERVEDEGQAARVRPEVLFVHDGDRWEYEREINGTTTSTVPKFDLSIFAADESLIGQSKAEGPGNYWDTETELSVLCEIKHSKNESANFYAASQGADDVRALAQYPGEVARRVFLFVDWWPVDGNGTRRYETHRNRLLDTVADLPRPVDVIYSPRRGDQHVFTIG